MLLSKIGNNNAYSQFDMWTGPQIVVLKYLFRYELSKQLVTQLLKSESMKDKNHTDIKHWCLFSSYNRM